MRLFVSLLFVCLTVALLPLGCVDPADVAFHATVNVVVVDGTITNLPEPQIIRLNQSRPNPQTGRFGFFALTKASVEVVVDSAQVITCHETVDGSYQLPSNFRGQVGHAYQLRFTLSDGATYQSSQQVMQSVPRINKLALRFNQTSLPAGLFDTNFRSGYDVFIDTQDPADQRNYYRWDWNLWEEQDWCQTCTQGYYMPNKLRIVSSYPNILIYQAQPDLLEDCFAAPADDLFGGAHGKMSHFSNDYVCRTKCWDIIHSSTLSLFNDEFSNGGLIGSRNVGQVPYYTQNVALVEIRQSGLTKDAYRYYQLFDEQTQKLGTLADTPPTALVGNVHHVANKQENVVGYFTAGAVSTLRYMLNKTDATGRAYGSVHYNPIFDRYEPVDAEKQLFYALNRRNPIQEPTSGLDFTILGGGSRPPTALCIPSDSRTPFKPEGWRD